MATFITGVAADNFFRKKFVPLEQSYNVYKQKNLAYEKRGL